MCLEVMESFYNERKHMKIYLVGGAVRDKILGKTITDRDWVVVGVSPETMLEQGYIQVGKDFPVFLHPKTKEEYALARTERKSGKGYKGFDFHAAPDVSLEQDLARRDLTINAIAQDENENLIDPYNGYHDIQKKLLRHVTEAFTEDPLRVLRVARFKARFHHLGFEVAPETIHLMRNIANSGELAELTPERVWVELQKALSEVTPSQFFITLRDCGALNRLFPEIDNLFGVPQRKDYHPEIDCGIHTMMVLDKAADYLSDNEVRFAALMHDLGKAETPEDILPRHIGHEAKSVKLINIFCKKFRVPKSYHELAVLGARYHTDCHNALELKASTILNLFEKVDAFRRPERLIKLLQACKADAQGRKNFEHTPYPQAEYLGNAFEVCQEIDAKPLIEQGIKGIEVGEALRRKRIQAIAMLKAEFINETSDA